MHLSFRQGIVTHPSNFLVVGAGGVSLSLSSTASLIVTIADGTSNYLIVERESITNAWLGPIPSDAWLYWDLNVRTGARTFGVTSVQPSHSNVAPTQPQHGQHWFDTTAAKMKVWDSTANRWINKIRVFAARVSGGSVITPMGVTGSFAGAQAAAFQNTPCVAGALVYDANGEVVKRNNGTFFTTEDVVVAGVASSTQVKLESAVIEAVAVSNIPAYSVVRFSDFNQVETASNADNVDGVYGMVERASVVGDVVNVVTSGLITNTNWNWTSVGVNAPLYINSNSKLTAVKTAGDQIPIASVIDSNTVMLRPHMRTIVVTNADTVPRASPSVAGLARLSVASTNPVDPVVVETNDPRLSSSVLKIGDTMTGPLLLSGDPTVNRGAATKQYVDGRDRLRIVDTAATYALTIDDNVNTRIRIVSATEVFVDIPLHANVNIPVGTCFYLTQGGVGKITVRPAAGVNVRTPETLSTRKQHSRALLIKVAEDVWELEGNLTLS